MLIDSDLADGVFFNEDFCMRADVGADLGVMIRFDRDISAYMEDPFDVHGYLPKAKAAAVDIPNCIFGTVITNIVNPDTLVPVGLSFTVIRIHIDGNGIAEMTLEQV